MSHTLRCSLALSLVVLRRPYRIMRIELGLAVYKANALLLLWPPCATLIHLVLLSA